MKKYLAVTVTSADADFPTAWPAVAASFSTSHCHSKVLIILHFILYSTVLCIMVSALYYVFLCCVASASALVTVTARWPFLFLQFFHFVWFFFLFVILWFFVSLHKFYFKLINVNWLLHYLHFFYWYFA